MNLSIVLKQDILGFLTLTTLCFFTCTNTNAPIESYGGIPTFSEPFIEFNCLMDSIERQSDSISIDFDRKVLQLERDRKRRDTIRESGHPFGKNFKPGLDIPVGN